MAGFQKVAGTTGLYVRDDNAQIWADTYSPCWHGRLADGTEALFYTYAQAEAWIERQDAKARAAVIRPSEEERARVAALPPFRAPWRDNLTARDETGAILHAPIGGAL